MITIEKIGDEKHPDIKISNENNYFMIARNNLPDLCWFPNSNANIENEDITFVINEVDGNIYTLFENLYNNVIIGNVFLLNEAELKNKSEKTESNYFNILAKETGLVKDGIIYWHSDDYDPYDYASILTIKKKNKQIIITFTKNSDYEESFLWKSTYAVRIGASGSRYCEYHSLFVNFYRQLQSIDWELPNNHIIKNPIQKELKKIK